MIRVQDADPDDFEEDEVENVVEELTSPNSTKTKFKVKGLGPSARRGSQALGKSVDLIRVWRMNESCSIVLSFFYSWYSCADEIGF